MIIQNKAASIYRTFMSYHLYSHLLYLYSTFPSYCYFKEYLLSEYITLVPLLTAALIFIAPLTTYVV